MRTYTEEEKIRIADAVINAVEDKTPSGPAIQLKGGSRQFYAYQLIPALLKFADA